MHESELGFAIGGITCDHTIWRCFSADSPVNVSGMAFVVFFAFLMVPSLLRLLLANIANITSARCFCLPRTDPVPRMKLVIIKQHRRVGSRSIESPPAYYRYSSYGTNPIDIQLFWDWSNRYPFVMGLIQSVSSWCDASKPNTCMNGVN